MVWTNSKISILAIGFVLPIVQSLSLARHAHGWHNLNEKEMRLVGVQHIGGCVHVHQFAPRMHVVHLQSLRGG